MRGSGLRHSLMARLLACLCVFSAAVAVYVNTLGAAFVFDDNYAVVSAPFGGAAIDDLNV